MKTQKSLFRIMMSGLICLMFVAAGLFVAADQVSAKVAGYPLYKDQPNDESWYYPSSINIPLSKAAPGVKVIGDGYIRGTDGDIDYDKWGCGLKTPILSLANNDAERETQVIQGVKIDKKYIVRQNMTNLFNFHNTNRYVQGYPDNERISWPSDPTGLEYYESEGHRVDVVVYDKDYVYFYCKGYTSFEFPQTLQCHAWTLTQSHPAGFYKIDRDYVILDLNKYKEWTTSPVVAKGQVIVGRLQLHPYPGRVDSGHIEVHANNSTVELLSKTPVKSKTPDKDGNTTYYKVVAYEENGKYRVGYMNSKYVNATTYETLPAGYTRGEVANAGTNDDIPLYSAKNTSKKTGHIYQVGAKIDINVAKSDSNWTAIAFNGGVYYLPAKYTRCEIDTVNVKTVVNNEMTMTWSKIPQKCRVELVDKGTGKVIRTITGVTGNEVKVIDSDWKKVSQKDGYQRITVKVAADYGKDYVYKTKEIARPGKPAYAPKQDGVFNNTIIIDTYPSYKLQYSTSSSFKNAKTIKAAQNTKTKKAYETKISGLKKNTTYYVRYAVWATGNTLNGKKEVTGDWSPALKVKTKNWTVYTPTLKSVSGASKAVNVKWAKSTKKGGVLYGFQVQVATNKSFTKNKKTITLATSGKKSWKVTGLKKKTKYYVRVRGYEDVGVEKYYSSWSKVKSVKTK